MSGEKRFMRSSMYKKEEREREKRIGKIAPKRTECIEIDGRLDKSEWYRTYAISGSDHREE